MIGSSPFRLKENGLTIRVTLINAETKLLPSLIEL